MRERVLAPGHEPGLVRARLGARPCCRRAARRRSAGRSTPGAACRSRTRDGSEAASTTGRAASARSPRARPGTRSPGSAGRTAERGSGNSGESGCQSPERACQPSSRMKVSIPSARAFGATSRITSMSRSSLAPVERTFESVPLLLNVIAFGYGVRRWRDEVGVVLPLGVAVVRAQRDEGRLERERLAGRDHAPAAAVLVRVLDVRVLLERAEDDHVALVVELEPRRGAVVARARRGLVVALHHHRERAAALARPRATRAFASIGSPGPPSVVARHVPVCWSPMPTGGPA